ncbi:hypothetical protein M3Y99_01595600 [Aphelenchoides fujianensis]|nr:hypothetical protein M3Y99_01595600 [Aphelenchoides fujianensis]
MVANHFDLDLICRFLETQFDSERHFEQGLGASVDDVETHLYAKAKRGVFCPFSLIVFEGERMVGLLLGSSWEHRAPPRHTPFALKEDYGDEVDGGPHLQREGNRVKAFEEILLDEFPYFVEPGAPRIGLVEMLVTAPEYNDGELERVLLSHALKRAADAETRFLGFLCATDADRAACGECGFTRFMDVKYADFFDRDFRGPAHLLDPKQSDRMSLYIAKTTR